MVEKDSDQEQAQQSPESVGNNPEKKP